MLKSMIKVSSNMAEKIHSPHTPSEIYEYEIHAAAADGKIPAEDAYAYQRSIEETTRLTEDERVRLLDVLSRNTIGSSQTRFEGS